MTVEILKFSDDEQRIVYGWASVSTIEGDIQVDHHNDQIQMEVLEKAATNYMLESRVGKFMHVGSKVAEVVHSLPLSLDIAKALGVQTDREGWIIGMKVYDDECWNMIKTGVLKAFSIGCRAVRKEVT